MKWPFRFLVCGLLPFMTLAFAGVARADEPTFVAAAQKYMTLYRDAKNELQKSALRKKRAEALRAALEHVPFSVESGWRLAARLQAASVLSSSIRFSKAALSIQRSL
jgi:hypothetical protein